MPYSKTMHLNPFTLEQDSVEVTLEIKWCQSHMVSKCRKKKNVSLLGTV